MLPAARCFDVHVVDRTQFNKDLSRIHVADDQSVTVEFQDGTQATGNIVIGCDGSHSRVREFLVGVEAAKMQDLPLTMINHARATYTAEQAQQLTAYHPIVKLAKLPDLEGGVLLAGKCCCKSLIDIRAISGRLMA